MSKKEFTQLVTEAGACRLCPRMFGRTAVLSDRNGTIRPKVMFIGEAPGQRGADRTRIPFHGDVSGRNFDALIASIGLTRDQIFITSAVLCNPRTADGRKNDKPTTGEIHRCNPFLQRQFEMFDPPVVATLGGVALGALSLVSSHSLKLNESVGQIQEWDGRLLVPLYHPAQRVLNKARPMPLQLQDYQMILQAIGRTDRKSKIRSP